MCLISTMALTSRNETPITASRVLPQSSELQIQYSTLSRTVRTYASCTLPTATLHPRRFARTLGTSSRPTRGSWLHPAVERALATSRYRPFRGRETQLLRSIAEGTLLEPRRRRPLAVLGAAATRIRRTDGGDWVSGRTRLLQEMLGSGHCRTTQLRRAGSTGEIFSYPRPPRLRCRIWSFDRC